MAETDFEFYTKSTPGTAETPLVIRSSKHEAASRLSYPPRSEFELQRTSFAPRTDDADRGRLMIADFGFDLIPDTKSKLVLDDIDLSLLMQALIAKAKTAETWLVETRTRRLEGPGGIHEMHSFPNWPPYTSTLLVATDYVYDLAASTADWLLTSQKFASMTPENRTSMLESLETMRSAVHNLSDKYGKVEAEMKQEAENTRQAERARSKGKMPENTTQTVSEGKKQVTAFSGLWRTVQPTRIYLSGKVHTREHVFDHYRRLHHLSRSDEESDAKDESLAGILSKLKQLADESAPSE